MSYLIKDENGDLMRVVGRLEEARQIVQAREGWSYQRIRKCKKVVDLSQLGEALF
jgi:hypothetical protein